MMTISFAIYMMVVELGFVINMITISLVIYMMVVALVLLWIWW